MEEKCDGAESAAEEATNAAAEGQEAEEEGAGTEESTNEDEGEHEARQVVVLMCSIDANMSVRCMVELLLNIPYPTNCGGTPVVVPKFLGGSNG